MSYAEKSHKSDHEIKSVTTLCVCTIEKSVMWPISKTVRTRRRETVSKQRCFSFISSCWQFKAVRTIEIKQFYLGQNKTLKQPCNVLAVAANHSLYPQFSRQTTNSVYTDSDVRFHSCLAFCFGWNNTILFLFHFNFISIAWNINNSRHNERTTIKKYSNAIKIIETDTIEWAKDRQTYQLLLSM